MENLSATELRAPNRGGRSVTILVVADVINCNDDIELSRTIVNDFVMRDEYGYNKYNQNLETNDGRPTEWDLYQELLDACQYARKDIEEGGTIGMLGYPALMALTRKTRMAILESGKCMEVWQNDGEKSEFKRAAEEAWGVAAKGDCEILQERGLSGSGQCAMVDGRLR